MLDLLNIMDVKHSRHWDRCKMMIPNMFCAAPFGLDLREEDVCLCGPKERTTGHKSLYVGMDWVEFYCKLNFSL